MVKQAEQNAAVDKSVVRRLTARTRLTLAYQAEKQLSDLGDKFLLLTRRRLKDWSKTCRLSKDDDERIKTLMPELQQALFAVGSNLYQQGGGGTTAGGPAR